MREKKKQQNAPDLFELTTWFVPAVAELKTNWPFNCTEENKFDFQISHLLMWPFF